MIDTNLALRTWLQSDAALAALVAPEHIVWPDLPESADPMSANWLTFLARGGTSETETPLVRPSFQITAWAKDFPTARAIYRAVFDLCHGATRVDLGDKGFVLTASEEVGGQDVRDPETQWPTVVMFLGVTFRV